MKTQHLLTLLLVGLLSNLPDSHAQDAKKEATSAAGISDPKDALKDIPRDVMGDLRPGSRSMVEAAGKASMQTAKNAEGKTGTFKFNVAAIEQFQRPEAPDVTLYRIRSVTDTVRESGVAMGVYLLAIGDKSENEKFAKLKAGSKVTFSGRISNAEILGRQRAELHIDLVDAKIVK